MSASPIRPPSVRPPSIRPASPRAIHAPGAAQDRESRQARSLAALLMLALLVACSGRDAEPAAGFPAANAATAASAPDPASPELYAAQARGRVDVAGGLLRVSAPRAGRVERWAVEEGEEVRAGQLLVTLDAREARAAVALARAELAHAQAQLGALGARLPGLRTRADRLRQAFEAEAGSGQAADDAREALVEAEQQQSVQRAALGLVRQRLAQAEQELAAAALRAPAAGRVLRRLRQAGEQVEPQGALLQILPRAPRVVRADLSEAMVARVRPGMRAEVVSVAEDGVAQKARVLRVGEVFGPPRTPDPGAGELASDLQAVECLLELDNGGPGQELRVGQKVLVRFLR